MTMKIHKWRRVLACVLSAVITVLLSMPQAAAAEETAALSPFSPTAPAVTASPFHTDDRVTIIVELEDRPLLEDSQMQTFSSTGDYFASQRAQAMENTLARARKQAKRELASSGMDIEVGREYSAVLNGLSVEADYGDLDAIRALPGVKNAFPAERYELIRPVAYEPLLDNSVPTIGGDIAQNVGYSGKGTAVAVLDTGLDTGHEAFGSVNSAKYTKEELASILSSQHLTVGTLNVNSLYVNDKIPYAYDYADGDTNVSGGDSHGTHVAGIVGANAGEEVTGVAPDAQFLIMKVFGDESDGAYDDDILAALDDAVKLGADAINMSLGSPAGFSEGSTSTLRAVYQRVESAGVSLMCAAGNSYSSSYTGGSGDNLPLAKNPDNSVVSSPSTYSAALSVASANNAEVTSPYFMVGAEKIRYDDSAEQTSAQLASLSGTYSYVGCGEGRPDEIPASVRGKIALIRRGGLINGENLTFAQKEANAAAKGAAAAVIYDNVEGDLVSMSTGHNIPCVFISKADGEKMLAQAEQSLTVSPSYIGEFKDSYGGQMSDFSSWGVTPDLKLKPEITAPGGNIYSTLPNGRYGSMSGTSMASPHMAGAAAVMEQYINEALDGLQMTQKERSELSNALMMSTAAPVKDESGNPYSPRKQGAGMVRLDRAVKAQAYLTGSDGGRPVANLKESEDGSFSFSFLVNSLSASSVSYEVTARVQTEDTVTKDGVRYLAQKARMLTSDDVTVTLPPTLSLPAKGDASVPVSFSLTQSGKAKLDADFPNGIFLEGYVTLTPSEGDSVPLSIPFMGFYGDWGDVPLFDATLYSGEQAGVTPMWLGQFRNADGSGYILGCSQYNSGEAVIGLDKIAIRGGDKTQTVSASCSLLRNADALTFSVADSGDNLVYQETDKNVAKTYYIDGESYHTPLPDKGWSPYDTWGDPLPDGRYTYTVTGTAGGEQQSVSFPITIDSEAPEVVSSVVEGSQWKVTVRDNHYVQAVCATMGSSALTGYINPDESLPGASTTITFDLSDPAFAGLTQAKIALVDYADNQFVSDYYSLSGAGVTEPVSVSLDRTQLQMTAGDKTTLKATVLPANASNRTVTWSSNNQKVATVSDSGEVTAVSEGSAAITASTVNGKTAACAITVLAKMPEPSPAVFASVSAPAFVPARGDIPFALQLEKMKNVGTVCFTFTRDAALTGGEAAGQNGFTVLDGIQWKENQGILMLSYLQEGAGGSLTREQLTDIARLTFQTALEDGSAGMTLTGVSVSGYDENGKAVYFDSSVRVAQAQVTIRNAGCDLNQDGVLDQLDITQAQRFYHARQEDSGWSAASYCDLDGNGVIDIADLVIILQAIAAP